MNWTREGLWREFVAFCHGREPSEDLARAFARAATADMHEPARELRRSAVFIVLQSRLIRAAQLRRNGG